MLEGMGDLRMEVSNDLDGDREKEMGELVMEVSSTSDKDCEGDEGLEDTPVPGSIDRQEVEEYKVLLDRASDDVLLRVDENAYKMGARGGLMVGKVALRITTQTSI